MPSDRELPCASCGRTFLFSASEQAYFAQNQFQDPRRCKPCRNLRKAQNGGGDHRVDSRPNHSKPVDGNFRPRRNGNAAVFQPAAADDPNGYRAPAFQDATHNPYKIDYAGLPKDEDEFVAESDAPARSADDVDRMGIRAPQKQMHFRGPRSNGAANGNNDPNGYRSPAFASSAPGERNGNDGSIRRARRASRMRHEAVCGDCGVAALVPFQPGPGRPAYCKPCYQVRKANGTAPIPPSASTEARPAAVPPASDAT